MALIMETSSQYTLCSSLGLPIDVRCCRMGKLNCLAGVD